MSYEFKIIYTGIDDNYRSLDLIKVQIIDGIDRLYRYMQSCSFYPKLIDFEVEFG